MVSSISSSSSSWAMQRTDSSQMASRLFSKLDTKDQGYIEKSDLETAFSSIASTDSSVSVDDVFSQLDTDGNGQVTEQEMSDSLQQLAEQLDTGFNNMRTQGMGQMPPPPPPEGEDEGFTAEELTSMASEIGETDSARSSLMSAIAADFETADSDGDGKVTHSEAMSYDQSVNGASSATATTAAVSATSSSSDSGASSASSEQDVLQRILQLAQAYGGFGQHNSTMDTLLNSLSVSA